MAAISVKNLSKYYGEKPVFTDIEFDIFERDRVGLIGRNGCGKTTLFRVLSGRLDYDSGSIVVDKSLRLEVLEQIPHFDKGVTVEAVMRSAFSHLNGILAKIKELETDMQYDHSSQTLREYDRLRAIYENKGGYEQDLIFNKTATGLGLNREFLAQDFSTLSGGEKTKVNLARIVISSPDVLLLDEPTNHLDMSAIEWIEDFLRSFRGTVIVISHDRYFLDRVVTRVIELDRTKITMFSGTYSEYMVDKEKRLIEQERRYELEQREIKRIEDSATKLLGWGIQTERLQRQAFSMLKRAERMKTTEKVVRDKRKIRGNITEADRSGFDALTIKELSAGYGEDLLFSDLNLEVKKGERIALLGNNGTGKSTFFKILLNEIMHFDGKFSGRVKFGANVKLDLLPQIINFDRKDRNLIDTLLYATNITPQTARNRLAAYDFIGEEVFKLVGDLSGGELSRLKLCLLSFDEINFFLLDEPTNHLDIASREWIEGILDGYSGTMIFISHDRYFINRFAERVLTIENNQISDFYGTFDEYRAERSKEIISKSARSEKNSASREINLSPLKEERALQRKITSTEKALAEKEAELAEIVAQIERCADDYLELERLAPIQRALSEEVDLLFAKWCELS